MASRKGHAGSWWRERLRVLQVAPQLWPLFALIFLQVAGFAMMEMALVLFCQRRFGFGAGGSGRLLAFVGAIMVAVQGGLIGPVVRRLGEAHAARAGLGCMAAALFLLPLAGPGELLALLGTLALLAIGQGVAGPSLSAMLSKAVPIRSQGAALGLSQSLSALARVLGPVVAGSLLDLRGEAAPLWAAGAVLSSAVLLAQLRLMPMPAAAGLAGEAP